MSEISTLTRIGASPVPVRGQQWTSKTGAWLGIGASSLGLAAGFVNRHRFGLQPTGICLVSRTGYGCYRHERVVLNFELVK